MASKREREVSIEVVSRHQHVSDRTRMFATEKAQRLTRFNDRTSRVQVILSEEHDQFLAEIIAHVECGSTLVAHGEADGFRAAMDLAFEKLGRQLRRHKEKRSDHKHESLGEQVPGDQLEDEESYADVVRHTLTD